MNQANQKLLAQYIHTIEKELAVGNATEHTHRPALKTLIEGLATMLFATNEPQRTECGAPDFLVTKGAFQVGYMEAKDVDKSLDEAEKSEQLRRYLGSLPNIILTDYLEFRWYVDGELRRPSARLGTPTKEGKIKRDKAGVHTGYPVAGSNTVEKVRYDDNNQRVNINKTQYFEGVPPEVWNFHIGGYQVAHKWLKDRKGRTLTYDELTHYQKVIVALRETIRLMEEIDQLIPGWPVE